MGDSTRTSSQTWLVTTVGAALLAGGLLALYLPVFLSYYDKYGIQIKCGNGYQSQLLQATTAGYVDQCKTAVAHRREWAIAAGSLGALILILKVNLWAQTQATAPRPPSPTGIPWDSAHPDAAMHEAAVLDRREHPHRERPPNTTL